MDDTLADLALRVLLEELREPAVLVPGQRAALRLRALVRVVQRDRRRGLGADGLEHVHVRHVHHDRALDVERALDQLRRAHVDLLHGRRSGRPRLRFGLVDLLVDFEAVPGELLH